MQNVSSSRRQGSNFITSECVEWNKSTCTGKSSQRKILCSNIYYPDGNRKKKLKLFVAKFLNRCLADVDGATFLSERPPHLENNAGNFEAYDIISGPLKVTFIECKNWDVPVYPNVVKTSNIVSKIDREEMYRQLYDLSAIPKKT